MTCVIQGITQFYLPANTSCTCLYSPDAKHHRPLAGTHFPSHSGEEAKLVWAQYLLKDACNCIRIYSDHRTRDLCRTNPVFHHAAWWPLTAALCTAILEKALRTLYGCDRMQEKARLWRIYGTNGKTVSLWLPKFTFQDRATLVIKENCASFTPMYIIATF